MWPRKGVADLLKVGLNNIHWIFPSKKNKSSVLHQQISLSGFFVVHHLQVLLEPRAMICGTKSLTENYYFWSRSIEQTNDAMDDLI